jgi:hypothetical protein
MEPESKQLNESDEAVGLPRRATSLNARLIVEFDWGQVEVTLDANQAEYARKELNKRVGTPVGLFLVTRPNGSPLLKLREV